MGPETKLKWVLTWITENLLIKFDRFQIIGQHFHDFTKFVFEKRRWSFYLREQKILNATLQIYKNQSMLKLFCTRSPIR